MKYVFSAIILFLFTASAQSFELPSILDKKLQSYDRATEKITAKAQKEALKELKPLIAALLKESKSARHKDNQKLVTYLTLRAHYLIDKSEYIAGIPVPPKRDDGKNPFSPFDEKEKIQAKPSSQGILLPKDIIRKQHKYNEALAKIAAKANKQYNKELENLTSSFKRAITTAHRKDDNELVENLKKTLQEITTEAAPLKVTHTQITPISTQKEPIEDFPLHGMTITETDDSKLDSIPFPNPLTREAAQQYIYELLRAQPQGKDGHYYPKKITTALVKVGKQHMQLLLETYIRGRESKIPHILIHILRQSIAEAVTNENKDLITEYFRSYIFEFSDIIYNAGLAADCADTIRQHIKSKSSPRGSVQTKLFIMIATPEDYDLLLNMPDLHPFTLSKYLRELPDFPLQQAFDKEWNRRKSYRDPTFATNLSSPMRAGYEPAIKELFTNSRGDSDKSRKSRLRLMEQYTGLKGKTLEEYIQWYNTHTSPRIYDWKHGKYIDKKSADKNNEKDLTTDDLF